MSYGRETVRAFVWGGDGASLACLSTYVCLARRLWLQPVLARAAQQAMQQHFAGWPYVAASEGSGSRIAARVGSALYVSSGGPLVASNSPLRVCRRLFVSARRPASAMPLGLAGCGETRWILKCSAVDAYDTSGPVCRLALPFVAVLFGAPRDLSHKPTDDTAAARRHRREPHGSNNLKYNYLRLCARPLP